MYCIKRTKPPPPGPMDAIIGVAPPAVHWATEAAALGNVTGWAADQAQAATFDEPTSERVLAYYASRPAAGRITRDYGPLAADVPQVAGATPLSPPGGPRPTEDDLREAIAQIERQREVIADLRQQLEAMPAPQEQSETRPEPRKPRRQPPVAE